MNQLGIKKIVLWIREGACGKCRLACIAAVKALVKSNSSDPLYMKCRNENHYLSLLSFGTVVTGKHLYNVTLNM